MAGKDQFSATDYGYRLYGPVPAKPKHDIIIPGARARLIRFFLSMNVIIIALWQLKNPFRAFRVLITLQDMRKKVHGLPSVNRYARSQRKFFWSENIPGWPSRAFNSHIKTEIMRALGSNPENTALQSVIWAISSCCPLKCDHCCEWDNLTPHENLSHDDLHTIIIKLQKLGLHHIQLSGGEPLARFDDLLGILEAGEKGIDFWILTSGFGLTLEKAWLLKKAGLVGANISLDHWEERIHNRFRNNDKSFYWARQAAINCRTADILISLSLCATRTFISEENLTKYCALAKEWGAGFIRIIEPRETGKFANKDVMLKDEQIRLLRNFYLQVNTWPSYRDYPIIMYPGFHHRRVGCFGAGDRYFYIDSKGDIHACPFCRASAGNAIEDPLIPAIKILRSTGCHDFMNRIPE